MTNSPYYKGTPANYVSPLAINSTLYIADVNEIWEKPSGSATETIQGPYVKEIYVDFNGKKIYTGEGGESVQFITSGTYALVYECYYTSVIADISGPIYTEVAYPTLTFYFTVVENQLPLKKWTIKDVINRLLDVAEPIRQGEEPRFKLNAEQAALFDNIIAPQFSFTKQTLRECLQEIGGVVHGEPRLNIKSDGGGWHYEISYDMYGGTEISHISTRPYYKCTVSQAIESYCTHIDTNAENLVNALGETLGSFFNDRNGTITEPYGDGFKTVRCDTMYSRISEENMLIATQLPIYAVKKVECGIIPNNQTAGGGGVGMANTTIAIPANATSVSGTLTYTGDGNVKGVYLLYARTVFLDVATATVTGIDGNVISFELTNANAGETYIVYAILILDKLVDITSYVFEASEYNSLLSSYDSAYPYSKAYGIMFTQGQKNITALNFKQEHPISSVFENYAIINILEEATGANLSALDDKYPLLAFRVTYTPFYSARVAQTKQV